MDQELLMATNVDNPRVLIVPTAAASENPNKAASNGIAYFSGLGANVSALMVVDSTGANDETFVGQTDDADVVYFTGGNPHQLLEVLRGSLLLRRTLDVLNRGGLIAGSSAGAMVLGSHLGFGSWSPSLKLVENIAVIPHHEGSDPNRVSADGDGKWPKGITILGIDSMTGVISGNDGWRVIGDGTVVVYNNSTWSKSGPNEILPLPKNTSFVGSNESPGIGNTLTRR